MKIKADSEKIKLIGDNIVEASLEFEGKTRALENEIDEIINVWDGEDAERYISLLRDNYVVNLKELGYILKDYGEYIKNIADIYSLLEQGTINSYNGGRY